MGKSIKELCEDLQYFYVDGHDEMTIGEIADKCREYIREKGFDCLDDDIFGDEEGEARCWIERNHPEWNTEGFELYSVLYNNLEFLCLDEYDEPCFREMKICFYGDYAKGLGVFLVIED